MSAASWHTKQVPPECDTAPVSQAAWRGIANCTPLLQFCCGDTISCRTPGGLQQDRMQMGETNDRDMVKNRIENKLLELEWSLYFRMS